VSFGIGSRKNRNGKKILGILKKAPSKNFLEFFQTNHHSGKTLTYLCPHAPLARVTTQEDSKEAVLGQKLD
jgi:hypothetical protein